MTQNLQRWKLSDSSPQIHVLVLLGTQLNFNFPGSLTVRCGHVLTSSRQLNVSGVMCAKAFQPFVSSTFSPSPLADWIQKMMKP